MHNTKCCPYCRSYKPIEEITYELRGRGSAKVKKLICKACLAGRRKHTSVAERDEFGQRVTAQNAAAQGRVSKNSIAKQQEGKTHD